MSKWCVCVCVWCTLFHLVCTRVFVASQCVCVKPKLSVSASREDGWNVVPVWSPGSHRKRSTRMFSKDAWYLFPPQTFEEQQTPEWEGRGFLSTGLSHDVKQGLWSSSLCKTDISDRERMMGEGDGWKRKKIERKKGRQKERIKKERQKKRKLQWPWQNAHKLPYKNTGHPVLWEEKLLQLQTPFDFQDLWLLLAKRWKVSLTKWCIY